MGYTPKHFTIEEFMPPVVLKQYGGNLCWNIMDDRILFIADSVRDHFGKPVIINNWKSGGKFSQRGYRTESVEAKISQHYFGRAIDFDVVGLTAEEVRKEILEKQKLSYFSMISRMESGVTWVHVDVCNTLSDGIVLFKA